MVGENTKQNKRVSPSGPILLRHLVGKGFNLYLIASLKSMELNSTKLQFWKKLGL